ncbi:hypothetical protein EKO00_18230 [Enterobacter roggenkampii]|nr:hypothetical protein EKO00_18230 [Enterobacter roggenkampii]
MAAVMFPSILVVCTGNMCRSPIGERPFSDNQEKPVRNGPAV